VQEFGASVARTRRSTFKKGRSLYVKLGDKDVEYNRAFRLFLHTKLSNPHYPPEIQAEATLINFTVTEQVCAHHPAVLSLA
jgi:dynein heavy chain, axonemal